MSGKGIFDLTTTAAIIALVVLAGGSMSSSRANATDERRDESQIKIGFEIAPVPLDLAGKNRALVGLGSYLVNASGDCNGCHSAGPQTEFVVGQNPYFGQVAQINPETYLGGGRDFGAFPDPAGPFPHIVSRNLTPKANGLPAGLTFAEFLEVLRTGTDFDHLHPTCTGVPDGTCLPPPFDGDLLQIMPWPIYGNMSDHQIRAIYEYLSAIPCIEGPDHPCF